MQIKIFTIPIMGGEKLLEEMNAFLPSKKILQVEQHLVQEVGGAVRYQLLLVCGLSGELQLAG